MERIIFFGAILCSPDTFWNFINLGIVPLAKTATSYLALKTAEKQEKTTGKNPASARHTHIHTYMHTYIHTHTYIHYIYIYIYVGMSQNEVSGFPLKIAILEPKTDTSC